METNSATSVWKSLGNLADDDLTDLYDESCVLSESDGFDMEAAVNQRLDWKPLSGPSPGARVVLDQARRDAWKKAKEEINFIRDRLASEFGTGNRPPSEGELKQRMFDHFFGPESRIFLEIKDHLGNDFHHEHFLKVLYAFLYSCCHGGLSAKDMYNERSELMRNVKLEQKSRVPSQVEYQKFFDRLGKSKRGGRQLWINLEERLNEMLQHLFVAEWEGDNNYVIDDDKAHFETMKRAAASQQLKVMKHARDNRFGFTCHHLVMPLSQMLVGITWEGTGDTTFTCTKRLVEGTLCPEHTRRGIPINCSSMQTLRLYQDRGYNNKEWLYNCIEGGGHLEVAMAQRNRMYPYTYDQLLKPGDTRVLLQTKGPRSLHMKETETESGQRLYFSAYVNGTSSVAMAVSTTHTRPTFDIVINNAKDADLYRRPLTPVNTDDFEQLMDTSMDEDDSSSDDASSDSSSSDSSITSSSGSNSSSDDESDSDDENSTKGSSSSSVDCQGTRPSRSNDESSMCESSSSSDESQTSKESPNANVDDESSLSSDDCQAREWKVRAFKEFGSETTIVTNEEDKELLLKLDIEPVTTRQNSCEWHLGRMFSLTSSGSDRAIALYDGNEPELKSQRAWKIVKNFKRRYKQTGTASDSSNQTTSQIPESIQASIAQICSPEEGREASQAMKAKIGSGEMGIEQITLHLQALGAKLSTAKDCDKKNRETLVKYLEDGERNRYSIMTKPNLETELKRATQRIGIRLKKQPTTRKDLVQTMLSIDNEQLNSENVSAKTLLGVIMQSSFMPRLTGINLEYCRLGHQLEGPLAKEILKMAKAKKTVFPIDRLYEAGLVAKQGRPFIKDSADLLGSSLINGKQTIHPVELKSRLSSKTLSKERQRKLTEMQTQSTRRSDNGKFCLVDATSANLGLYLQCPHEAIQCLHHAYCYDSEFVLLVIGNRKGTIESGIWIRFSIQLRKAYEQVLTDLYLLGLRWAYEPDVPKPVDCQVKAEIEANPRLKLDLYTWNQWIELFHSIMNDIGFPLPPTERIIPLIFSAWNAGKSGSDTISKLLAKLQYNIPSHHPQAVAIARMIETITVVCFRSSQIFSAKPDLPHPSLKHYRNAASHRMAHREYLQDMMAIIEDKLFPNNEFVQLAAETTTTITTPRSTTRTTRRRRQIVESDAVARKTKSTPKKRVLEIYRSFPTPIDLSTVYCAESLDQCVKRMKACTGFPLYRVCNNHDGSSTFDSKKARQGAGARGTCAVCDKQTNYWCRGCHHSFCVGNENGIEGEAQMLVLNVRDSSGKQIETVKGRLDCSSFAHKNAIDRVFS